ncbi:hypothetical protein [Neolewinella persica]|uniref:hypothetical protein n=1 Tax=Neolewinella persica TaxID=70998 RepID=UPI0003A7464D|nr:hypothetical protein [Neolewinella persica]
MRFLFTLLLSCCFMLQLPAQSANLMGFTAEGAAAQPPPKPNSMATSSPGIWTSG